MKAKQEQAQQFQPVETPSLQEQKPAEEVTLSDGVTDNIPPLPEQQPEVAPVDFSADFSPTMTTSNFYSPEEFAKNFADFLDFLKNPATATDAFETLRAEGQSLAADKVYNMATKYKWLNWLIDRRTRLLHDAALLSLFVAVESNAIIVNWTGISIFEKGKLWLKNKIKQRQTAQATSGRRSVWGFLGRQAVEKPQKQES